MHAPGTPAHSRILALDVGSKRIGVAISDPLGITAQGLDTIQRQNKRRDLEALGRVLAKYEVREIVVGLPLRLSGAEAIGKDAPFRRRPARALRRDRPSLGRALDLNRSQPPAARNRSFDQKA